MALFASDLMKKDSIRGMMIDKMGKAIFLNAVSYTDGVMAPIAEEKNKNGWVNPEMKILYDIFTDIIACDEPLRKQGQDHIRDLYTGLRNLVCVTLDEDSHYLARFYFFCYLIHKHYPELDDAFQRSKLVYKWDEQAKWLEDQLERRKQGLPFDFQPLEALKARGARPKSPEEIEKIRQEKKEKELNEGQHDNSDSGTELDKYNGISGTTDGT